MDLRHVGWVAAVLAAGGCNGDALRGVKGIFESSDAAVTTSPEGGAPNGGLPGVDGAVKPGEDAGRGSLSGADAGAAQGAGNTDAGPLTGADSGAAQGGAGGSLDAGSQGGGSLDAGSQGALGGDAGQSGNPGSGGGGFDAGGGHTSQGGADAGTGSSSGGGSGNPGGGGSSGGALDGGVVADLDANVTRDQFCSGRGPVIKVPDPAFSADVCTGTVARKVFKNALCTCDSANVAGYIQTSSFDSLEPGITYKSGAAVGINQDLSTGSYIDVGGTFRVHGGTELTGGTALAGYLNVGGDLELAGGLLLPGYLTVGRDAYFQSGVIIAAGSVERDLYTRPGNLTTLLGVGGQHIEKDFTLDMPCPCDPSELLDVDGIVQDGKLHNDNANPAINLSATALSGVVGSAKIELPCGRFYVDEITGVGSVTLVVNGRTALFVGGDVANTGKLDVKLGPQGELDMFIAGNLNQIGYGVFGDVNRPAGVRVYVGGNGDITYLGYQPFGGNLYAPKSRLLSNGFVDVRGSLFVRVLDDAGYLKVVYDREILQQGNDPSCTLPPASCSNACDETCSGGSTCVGGSCQACTRDEDCCAPLVCYENGKCGVLSL